MLSWGEIREMHQQGINFDAHTCTHPDLTRLPLDRVEAEVCNSKVIIEDALGVPVACFAYPYGRYDTRSRDIVRRHFVCACSDRLGLITAGSDPYALGRVDTYYLRSERLFALTVSRLFPLYIRARNIPRGVRRTILDLLS
jgi:peptidoglycan/xylan/chitin deacetylase (PgdA/CDA1 family)